MTTKITVDNISPGTVETVIASNTSFFETISPPRYITLNQPGTLTFPFTGVARVYPTANLNITFLYATLGTASTANLVFSVKKNGTLVDSYTIPSNTNRLEQTNTSISLTTSDYLTVDLVSGEAATDLQIDFEFTYT